MTRILLSKSIQLKKIKKKKLLQMIIFYCSTFQHSYCPLDMAKSIITLEHIIMAINHNLRNLEYFFLDNYSYEKFTIIFINCLTKVFPVIMVQGY